MCGSKIWNTLWKGSMGDKVTGANPFAEPVVPKVTETPSLSTEEKERRANSAEAAARRKAAAAMGASATILTSGQGVSGTAPTMKKTLLGA